MMRKDNREHEENGRKLEDLLTFIDLCTASIEKNNQVYISESRSHVDSSEASYRAFSDMPKEVIHSGNTLAFKENNHFGGYLNPNPHCDCGNNEDRHIAVIRDQPAGILDVIMERVEKPYRKEDLWSSSGFVQYWDDRKKDVVCDLRVVGIGTTWRYEQSKEKVYEETKR
jgi:hypothetical protein